MKTWQYFVISATKHFPKRGLIFAFFVFLCSAAQAKQIHFAAIENLAEQEIGKLIITAVYDELDIDIAITSLPAKRAQLTASKGQTDGEVMRIFTYGDENKATIRVPTPYYSLETTAFVKRGTGITLGNKDDLTRYFVAKIRGVKHTNNITKGLPNVIDMSSTKEMFTMLESERIEIALTNRLDGTTVMGTHGFTNIHALPKPLATLPLYHYIHKTRKYLVPMVNQKIIELKESGKLAEIVKAAEQSVLQQ